MSRVKRAVQQPVHSRATPAPDTIGRQVPRATVAAVPGLLHWRVERAMTQAELAEKSGIDRTTIARLERGASAKMETIRRLADALDVEPGQLLRPPRDN